ncbi:MAG TPA: response regulator [Gemmatimonadales bacterium]|nr:response regulator [Gemmatimonadales bacterium]
MSIEEQSTSRDTSPLVLIANDQEWTARAVETILVAAGFRVLRTHTAGETLQVAAAVDPDLMILDHQLPDFSGVEVCRRLRADPRFGAGLPVIITTAGASGRAQRLAAYDAGAWEFYGQPLDPEALLQKLRVYYASYRELRRLRDEALIDHQTGLYSRLGLARRATEFLGEARRAGRAVSCVRWSVPMTVDAPLLSRVGAAFRVNGRAADALGRLGDGEFAAVAPDTGIAGADRLAERLRDMISQTVALGAEMIRTTVVAVEDPGLLPSDGDQLLDRLTPALAA